MMKLSDFDTKQILNTMADHQGHWLFLKEDGEFFKIGHGVDDTPFRLFPEGTPRKLILLKMMKLIKKGYSGGCGCGCRGDYEITDKGLAFVDRKRTEPYSGY